MMRAWLVSLALVSAACGSKSVETRRSTVDAKSWPADDRSMCAQPEGAVVEVDEIAGAGAPRPNIRRVFVVTGSADKPHRGLVCREVDTNLDGIKDVARFYDGKGSVLTEQADRDYDGVLDTWTTFIDGKVAQIDVSTKKTGKPDEWRIYTDGVLTRVKRDLDGDGRPDRWEVYNKGTLERIGVDETGDGHVDRWDRDEVVRLEQAEEEQRLLDAQKAREADAGPAPADDQADAGPADAGPKRRRR